MFRGMGVSAVTDFSACQLMPSFPKVFLFSPVWEKYLSHRSYAPFRQSIPSSGGQFDDHLSFHIRQGPLHSSSCFLREVSNPFSHVRCSASMTSFRLLVRSLGSRRVDSVSAWSGMIGLLRSQITGLLGFFQFSFL